MVGAEPRRRDGALRRAAKGGLDENLVEAAARLGHRLRVGHVLHVRVALDPQAQRPAPPDGRAHVAAAVRDRDAARGVRAVKERVPGAGAGGRDKGERRKRRRRRERRSLRRRRARARARARRRPTHVGVLATSDSVPPRRWHVSYFPGTHLPGFAYWNAGDRPNCVGGLRRGASARAGGVSARGRRVRAARAARNALRRAVVSHGARAIGAARQPIGVDIRAPEGFRAAGRGGGEARVRAGAAARAATHTLI